MTSQPQRHQEEPPVSATLRRATARRVAADAAAAAALAAERAAALADLQRGVPQVRVAEVMGVTRETVRRMQREATK